MNTDLDADDSEFLKSINRRIEALSAINPSGMSAARHWAIALGKSAPTFDEQRLLNDPDSIASKHHRQVLETVRAELSPAVGSASARGKVDAPDPNWVIALFDELRQFVQLHTGRALVGYLGEGRSQPDIVELARPRGLPLVRLSGRDGGTVGWEPIFDEGFDPTNAALAVHRLNSTGATPAILNAGLLLQPEGPGLSAFAVTWAEPGRFIISKTRIVFVESSDAPSHESLGRWIEAHQSLRQTPAGNVRDRLELVGEIIRILARSVALAQQVDRASLGALPGGRLPRTFDSADWNEMTVTPLMDFVLTPLLDWIQSHGAVKPG